MCTELWFFWVENLFHMMARGHLFQLCAANAVIACHSHTQREHREVK